MNLKDYFRTLRIHSSISKYKKLNIICTKDECGETFYNRLYGRQTAQNQSPALVIKVGKNKITNRHNTKRNHGKPNVQFFPKRWPLSYINLNKHHLNTLKTVSKLLKNLNFLLLLMPVSTGPHIKQQLHFGGLLLIRSTHFISIAISLPCAIMILLCSEMLEYTLLPKLH